jgi:hypothetical protein
VGGKGSGRGENLGIHEVFAPLNDSGLFFNLPFHHVTEHASSVIVKMAQSLVKPVPHLGWESPGVAMSRECGRCRLAPASAP